MESGALQVVLPRGGIVEAEIAPISGTGYNYLLSLPLSQYDPGETNYAASIARLGEIISFQINNAQAMVRDVNASTTSSYGIPSAPGDAVGMSTILNPFLSGGDAFPLGDVDTSGARTSTDAMLVLQYDIGLIGGDDSFPAGPGKIYLPLCDIVADGQCNASDALRILLCDVGMAGISCPASASTAAVAVEESDKSAEDVSEENLSDAVLLLRQTVAWDEHI